ncbi:MAG TPA: RNA polymerase sigma-70 factor [Nocardioidaceae bacterium]|jgi:RNA polymerase sigma-70 factor (ECF subfamily)
MTDLAAAHDDLRPLMFSIAYRMTGSVAEAEDVVQEAFLRMHQHDRSGSTIESPEAFATTVTTRLAIDALRSARRRREQYVGPWLPEPLVDEDEPSRRIEMDETVSVAFLMVLERLSPVERAVFLLREVFGYDYAEIARVVERTEANCRQLLARARRHLAEAQPRFEPSAERRVELAQRFFAALQGNDLAELERMLAEDVVFYGDGGGKAPAIRQPMYGAPAVARFLLGLYRRGAELGGRVEPAVANGEPAARLLDADGSLLGVLTLHVAEGRIAMLGNQINPDKLGHLGRVGDMFAMLRGTAGP